MGPGTHFLSGISYYTYHLCEALAPTNRVSAIFMRRLIPRFLYPGRERVGQHLASVALPRTVVRYDGIDWYWGWTIIRAALLLVRERPSAVIFQWWTGAVLHSYLALALLAKLLGSKIVIEFHEVQDPGEAGLPLAGHYMRLVARPLIRMASSFVVHSQFDVPHLEAAYGLGDRSISVIPVAPLMHGGIPDAAGERGSESPASGDVCRLLFFGTIRPYKGLEDLLEAFSGLSDEEAAGYRLTIVGETWEGWTKPLEMIDSNRHRERITLVNAYVPDEDVSATFAEADAVVLPYHRSSASGPLHVAMHAGLPIMVTDVGGLPEAVEGYQGAVLIPPRSPHAIRERLPELRLLCGTRYENPHTWTRTAQRYEALLERVLAHET